MNDAIAEDENENAVNDCEKSTRPKKNEKRKEKGK